MAKDNLRSSKVKTYERVKLQKKTVTQDASPETSTSKRSSRTSPSSKQTKELPSSTRKSKRLENSKQSESPPIEKKSKTTQEQMATTPTKRYSRRNKPTYVGSSGSEQNVEDPSSPNTKSKKEDVKRSLKMDLKEDKRRRKKKRKRVTSVLNRASSKPKRIRTEAGDDNDKESQNEATSSSNRDEGSGSKSVEDKGDDDVEESTLKYSEALSSTSSSSLTNFSVKEINGHIEEEESPSSKKVEEEPLNDTTVDLEQVVNVGSSSIENRNETTNSGKSSSSKRDTSTKKTDPESCTNTKEFLVPVQISNVQLEQYCSMILTNAMALSSCSKSDTVGALHDILVSNRKCCDHPYIVDQSLQGALTKDLELAKFLEVGIKASGKLQFLDLILPEMRKRELKVLILFQPLSGTGKDSTSIGDILDDFVRQRFGEDSYERVDAIITTPSKRQAALNNFNNKEKGRFVFLLDYRACQPSIKLSSVDTIIIFDSDWNPANDIRALQKIAIDSNPEQIKIFRLYTSWTLEEKILKLSEDNVTIDKGLQNISRSISDALLMWGATHLFKKLNDFHNEDIPNENEEQSWNELKEEFLNLVNDKDYTSKLISTKVQQSSENVLLVNELPGGEQPHEFWKKLLAGKDPCWKYLTRSTPRQRKRPQFYEGSPQVTNAGNEDGVRKRKKTAPVTEKVISSDESQRSPDDSMSGAASCDDVGFRHLLKLNISELCRVLKLSEEVKKTVQKFLEYVIENYQVNKEPANTLQAFLISLCWIGSSLLKKKLDRKQTLAIAKKRLNFTCEEEETNSVYLKLEGAKDAFLLDTENKKEKKGLKETKVEMLDSPEEVQYVTISPDTSDNVPEHQCVTSDNVPEDHNDNNSLPAPAPAPQEKIPPLVSPPNSVPTNSVTTNSVATNSVEIQDKSVEDISHTKEAEKADEIITETPLVEKQQHEAPPQVVETTTDNQNPGTTERWTQLFNFPLPETHNRGPRNPSCTDPLEAEMERLNDVKNNVNHLYEAIKGKLKTEYEKEIAEVVAKINRKYEDRFRKADAAYQTRKNEIDVNVNKVVMNKILAEAFRSKCRDHNPFSPAQTQAILTGEMQYMYQLHGMPLFPPGQPLFTPGQPSGSNHVRRMNSSPQIVHQSANLFSNTSRPPPAAPSPPPSTTPPPPPRPPPPANISTTTTPPNMTSIRQPLPPPDITTSTTKPPPNITTTTPSVRNPRLTGEIRAPAPHIRPFKPSTSTGPPPSSATISQTPAKPPPPSSSQPPSPSIQLPPLHTLHISEQNPPGNPPATSSSTTLPPMPSVQISQSGLYGPSGKSDVMSLSALDLLMDVDKNAGQVNVSPSQLENWEATLLGKSKSGDGELVCLSDDD